MYIYKCIFSLICFIEKNYITTARKYSALWEHEEEAEVRAGVPLLKSSFNIAIDYKMVH